MSPGQIAALVAAGGFVLLVVLLAIPLLKLGRALDEASTTLRAARENSDPLFTGANTTLDHVNTQLSRVDGITQNARAVSSNVSALTALFTATLGGPLVKTAAFSYGVSKAIKAKRAAKTDDGRHSRRPRRGGRR